MNKTIKLIIALIFLGMIVLCIIIFQPTTEEAVHIAEDFKDESYVNYPKITNIIDYLEIDVATVQKLIDDENELVFCFLDTSSNEMLYDYIRQLQDDDFEVELYDGTISSTFVISGNDVEIEITTVSDIDPWKEYQEDEYLQQITNENTVCKISVVE
ncbi:MAG: hypothetical protein R3Y24_10545 [Eubacteriales bacterium]